MGHIADSSRGLLNGLDSRRPRGPLRGLDPRSRILGALLFSVVVVSLSDPLALIAALCLAVTALFAARPPLAPTLRRLAAINGFVLFMLVTLPFTVPGATLISIGPLTATVAGLSKAVVIALKANTVVLFLLATVGTIEATRFGHALYRLRVPENLVHLLLFTVRYLEVLQREYVRLRTAMKARGFETSNSLHTYRSIGFLIGMLLVRSLERSERILEAMKCRGFRGRLFLLDESRFGDGDVLFAGVALTGAGALYLLEFRHWIA